MQRHAENVLVGKSEDYQKGLGYLKFCVTTCYARIPTT